MPDQRDEGDREPIDRLPPKRDPEPPLPIDRPPERKGERRDEPPEI
jgi:hypothetical protein